MLLNLSYQLLDHPYPDEPSSIGEQWAKIRLEILDENEVLIKTVFDWQWDINIFLIWLIENEIAIKNENIPINSKSSLAMSIANFYEQLDDDTIEDDKLVNAVYEYRTRHEIGFGLRGTDINNACIGLLDNKSTISFCGEDEEWDYEIDISDFFSQVHDIYKQIGK
jgi:hypothetical protein